MPFVAMEIVIKSFANRATERFAVEGKAKFTGMDVSKAMARLQVLHAATSLDDIRWMIFRRSNRLASTRWLATGKGNGR
jgi:plasmid maintenance system killer protein